MASAAGHAAVPSEVSDSLLEDLIAAHLVLPNRVTVPVKKGLDVTNLLFPLPCVSTRTGHRAWAQRRGTDRLEGGSHSQVVAWSMPCENMASSFYWARTESWEDRPIAQSPPSREGQSPGGIPYCSLVLPTPCAAWVGDCEQFSPGN